MDFWYKQVSVLMDTGFMLFYSTIGKCEQNVPLPEIILSIYWKHVLSNAVVHIS